MRSGRSQLDFNPSGHIYKLDGAIVPSVTRILSDLRLIPDYPQVEIYKARGRAVHLATELFDHGKLAEIDERLEGYLEAWKGFKMASGFECQLIEHRVFSNLFKYAGTIDRVGALDGKPTIVDIKSGAIAGYAALQTSAYRRALLESDGIEVHRRVAVQVNSTGKFKVVEYQDHAGDDRLFLAALGVWRWREKNL